MNFKAQYEQLAERLTAIGINVEAVKDKLKAQHIETPSWGYGNSGTRFQVFPAAGAARTLYEKIDDAAYVHSITGVAPSIAIHIPWDKVDDYDALGQYSGDRGISIGAVNPNVFQDEQYKLGSMTHPSAAVREEAVAAMVECCEIMGKVGSQLLSLWFADGTNYAGQDDIIKRKHYMEEALSEVYRHLPGDDSRMLIEYKFFEPAFYHTDLPDWGTSYMMALKTGPRADVLVDTGHHAQGTNIAHIVALLLDEERLGGFHFNARRYADDDLIVGTNNPMELFEIYTELVKAGPKADKVAYMLDQSHNIEAKLEGVVLSVMNCQTAYAKALIVDYKGMAEKQNNGDVLGGHATLMDAFETDVRPLLMQVREEMGIAPDPLAALRAGDYVQKITKERGKASAAGGYTG
jgi:L-rhamnose isomerase/sugar isomerase